MKVLHTADWHLGAYVGPQSDNPLKRMEHTMKCLDVLVETAMNEQPDIILVAGDIFHVSKCWADRAMTEVRIAIDYLSALGQVAPVTVLYGTPNHDNLESFKVLEEYFAGKKHPYVRFFTQPVMVTIDTKSGPIQVAGLPGFDKGHFRTMFPGLSAEEENKVFSEQLALIVQGFSANIDQYIPSVLMAHHTVVGCELDNGQHVFMQNDVVLPASCLDNSSFDLICLGHIHKAQLVPVCHKPVYYAGSLDAFTFNDEGHEKGFFVHFVRKPGFGYSPMWFKMPAREFVTCRWDSKDLSAYNDDGIEGIYTEPIKNKVVRILYTCDDATEKALDKKKLERDLYAAGAYYVSEIRPEKIHEVVNRERLHEKLTVSDCLERYLKEKGMPETEISQFMSEAVDIFAEASANLPAGGQTGLFLPVEIEVRNYRSYAEEKFSFEDIFFAMVNGRNGSGKSSLFMDLLRIVYMSRPGRENLLDGFAMGKNPGVLALLSA